MHALQDPLEFRPIFPFCTSPTWICCGGRETQIKNKIKDIYSKIDVYAYNKCRVHINNIREDFKRTSFSKRLCECCNVLSEVENSYKCWKLILFDWLKVKPIVFIDHNMKFDGMGNRYPLTKTTLCEKWLIFGRQVVRYLFSHLGDFMFSHLNDKQIYSQIYEYWLLASEMRTRTGGLQFSLNK